MLVPNLRCLWPTKREAARRKQQHAYEQELMQLCALYVRTSAPMHTLL